MNIFKKRLTLFLLLGTLIGTCPSAQPMQGNEATSTASQAQTEQEDVQDITNNILNILQENQRLKDRQEKSHDSAKALSTGCIALLLYSQGFGYPTTLFLPALLYNFETEIEGLTCALATYLKETAKKNQRIKSVFQTTQNLWNNQLFQKVRRLSYSVYKNITQRLKTRLRGLYNHVPQPTTEPEAKTNEINENVIAQFLNNIEEMDNEITSLKKANQELSEQLEKIVPNDSETNKNECSICFEEIEEKDPTLIHCSTKSHIICIKKWTENGLLKCPTCRQDI